VSVFTRNADVFTCDEIVLMPTRSLGEIEAYQKRGLLKGFYAKGRNSENS